MEVCRKRISKWEQQRGPRGGDLGYYEVFYNEGRFLVFDWTKDKEMHAIAKSRQREVWLEFYDKVRTCAESQRRKSSSILFHDFSREALS